MGLLRFFCQCFLKVFTFLAQSSLSFVCSLLYASPKELPPIRNPILLLPATELAKRIRTKQLKSVEVVEAYMSRIDDVQPFLNAVAAPRYELALEEARKVDELIESGAKNEEELEKQFPLLGVPFSCKEAIAVKGMPHTAGVYARKGVIAEEDSEVVRRFRNAGAIPLVSTNTAEFCMSWNSQNYVYGDTRNAYDTRKMAGGSSGGEGALVGSAGSVVGIGSDLGGSIRIPACFNGIFGHKPSRSYSPISGYYPEVLEAHKMFWNTGPLCRYACDLPLVMKIISNNDPDLKLSEKVDLRQLKIYYAEDDGGNPCVTPVVPELKSIMRDVLNRFKKDYGVESEQVRFEGLKQSSFLWFQALDEACSISFENFLNGGKNNPHVLLEILKWCLRVSNHTVPALVIAFYEKYLLGRNPKSRLAALKEIEKLESQFKDILKHENCVFLYPTHPEPAPYDAEVVPKFFNVGYTAIFNVLGIPVTQCPLVLCQGVPIGVQVVAGFKNDRTTIAVAEEIEKMLGGWTSPSPVI